MQNFRELKIWDKSHHLTLTLYKITENFPREELYGLTSQIRRASSSIATNIAEGCCRNGNAEFARFLWIAIGSASELEYLILLSKDLGFLSEKCYLELTESIIEIKKMTTALIQKLKADN